MRDEEVFVLDDVQVTAAPDDADLVVDAIPLLKITKRGVEIWETAQILKTKTLNKL